MNRVEMELALKSLWPDITENDIIRLFSFFSFEDIEQLINWKNPNYGKD